MNENQNQIDELNVLNNELVLLNKKSKKLSDELTTANERFIKSEEKIIKIQRLYAFISQVNQNIVRINDETILFQNACRLAHKFGKFKMAWIGIFNEENKTINLVGHSGIEPEEVKLFMNAPWQSNGPQDYVLQTGTYYLCNDIEHDLKIKNWKPFAAKHGIQSCMVLPIKKLGVIIGTLNLYSTELNFTGKEEIALLVEVASDISFALDRFEKERKHKETEDLLIQSEKHFHAMIEKGSDIITLSSLEGKFSYVSPSALAVLGYNKEEMLSITAFDFIHPDDIPRLVEQTKIILKTPGSSLFRQQRYLTKKGNWIWCEGTITNMTNVSGINALVSNFKDISDKKLVEQQQEFESNNLNALINNTKDLMWSVDTDFNLITSNIPFDEMLIFLTGSKLSKGSNALNLPFPKEQLEKFKAYYERAFAGEIFSEIEHTESPYELWSEISFYPILKGDNVIGTACHSRDITNIKKSEYQLKKSELFSRGVIDSLTSHIAVVNSSGIIVAVNEAWKNFAKKNGDINLLKTSEKSSYLKVCNKSAKAGVYGALEVLQGIKDVLDEKKSMFYLEYPCHSPTEQRWFGVQIIKFDSDEPMVVVSHQNITVRKLAEENLLKSLERLKEAQALANTGSWEFDFKKNVHTWSDQLYTILGIEKEGALPSTEFFLSLIYPEDAEEIRVKVEKAFETLDATSYHFRFIRKDGELRYGYTERKFEFDKNNEPIRLVGVVQDITERKLTEIALKESEANMAEAQRLAKMGSWNFDIKADKFTWSDELYTIFDTNKQTFIETYGSFIHLIDETDRDFALQTSRHSQITGEPFIIEYGITTSKGEKKTIKEQGYGERDAKGNIVRLFGTAQDITEHKLVEEELQKLATIVKHSSQFITIATIDAKSVYINEGGKKIVSLNRDIETTTMFDFFAQQDIEFFKNTVIPAIQTNGRWAGEIHLRNFETGERISVQMDVFYVYKPNTNKPIAYATVTTDLSERKKIEEKLELQNAELIKTNSELDKFIYSISHDLRSPLMSILGLLSFIEKESNEPNILEYAGMIRTSIIRQDEFIKNILIYSQNNRSELDVVNINIQKNLDEIVDSLRNIKSAEGISIEVDIKEKDSFYTDKHRFNTIIENLISNAIKYHKKELEGRYIKIKGISDNDTLHISIEDNGIGIDPEYHSKIFDMFFRLPGKAAGSGIGLYIVKETINKIQGTIEMSSEEGIGTRFSIVLKNLKP